MAIFNITEKLKLINRSKNMNITVTSQSLALTLTDLGKLGLMLKHKTCSHIRVKVIWFSMVNWRKTLTTLFTMMLTSSC